MCDFKIISSKKFQINKKNEIIYLIQDGVDGYSFVISKSEKIEPIYEIGRIKLYDNTFGYSINKEDYRGFGIMPWAVKEIIKCTNLKKYIILTMPKNKASQRVAEKCGFKREWIYEEKIDAFSLYKYILDLT